MHRLNRLGVAAHVAQQGGQIVPGGDAFRRRLDLRAPDD